MNNVKACIFDLDGVLVDTAKYHFLAWKKLATELNIEFTEKDNENLKGVSRMHSVEILLNLGNKKINDEVKLKLADKKNAWYVEYISHLTPADLLPGVKEFFYLLEHSGIKIALGSASKNSMLILNKLNLVNYFDAIVDGNKITQAKPNPEVFLKCAEELKISPKNCVVFEDSKAGIDAAINAGMYSIGIGSPSILEKANFVVNSLADMNLEKLTSLK